MIAMVARVNRMAEMRDSFAEYQAASLKVPAPSTLGSGLDAGMYDWAISGVHQHALPCPERGLRSLALQA